MAVRFDRKRSFLGEKILVTSGPTRAKLDAVRYLSNTSTGRFGTLLAESVLKRGAHVTFVCGKGSERPRPNPRLQTVAVETNEEAAAAIRRVLKKKQIHTIVHAMALLDFRAARVRRGKTETRKGVWSLTLVPTPKIVRSLKKWSPHSRLIAFKLERGISKKEMMARGRRLLKASKADAVLVNTLQPGRDASHAGWLLDRRGKEIGRARGKSKLVRLLLDFLARG